MKKILLIDDDVYMRDIISLRLSDAGYDVSTANNGQDALLQIEKEIPDLILLDLDMPGMHGSEVVVTLRSKDRTKLLPIIIFSNDDQTEIVNDVIEKGANEFCLKADTEIKELIEKIEGYTK